MFHPSWVRSPTDQIVERCIICRHLSAGFLANQKLSFEWSAQPLDINFSQCFGSRSRRLVIPLAHVMGRWNLLIVIKTENELFCGMRFAEFKLKVIILRLNEEMKLSQSRINSKSKQIILRSCSATCKHDSLMKCK